MVRPIHLPLVWVFAQAGFATAPANTHLESTVLTAEIVRHGILINSTSDKQATAQVHQLSLHSAAADPVQIHGEANERQHAESNDSASLATLSARGEVMQSNPHDGFVDMHGAAAPGPAEASLSEQSGQPGEQALIAQGAEGATAQGDQTAEGGKNPPCQPCSALIRGGGGPAGPPGPVGPRGPIGAPGPTGVVGPRGETGYSGPPGERGPNGTNGTNGTRGPTQLDGVPAGAAKIQYVFIVVGLHVCISFMAYQVLKINEQKYKQEAHLDELESKAAAFDMTQGGKGGY